MRRGAWAHESKNMESGEARGLLHFYRCVGHRRFAFCLAAPPIYKICKVVNNEEEHVCARGIRHSYPYGYKFIGGVR